MRENTGKNAADQFDISDFEYAFSGGNSDCHSKIPNWLMFNHGVRVVNIFLRNSIVFFFIFVSLAKIWWFQFPL